MDLLRVQNSAQEVAEAISAVLNVDVTIADKDLKRVASTGRYRDFIGERLPENCSFETIYRSKKPEFIDRPNKSHKCMNCSSRGSCYELATIGYPIMDDNKLLGIIGLIAFTEEQRSQIQEKFDSLIVFLSKLGDLLAGNLKYSETIRELRIQDEETKEIINGVSKGIICTDGQGKIKFINDKVRDYFELESKDIIDRHVSELIKGYRPTSPHRETREVRIELGGKKKSFILDYIPVLVDGKLVSSIVELQKTSSMIKNVYKLIASERIISFDDIIGRSREIEEVKDLARSVARSKSTVLLRGDSGTGKELFARSIHNESDRDSHPFIAINCASIPDNLLESELFGYERGAFTGAKKEGHIGKFELARGGSLFLDEIGDLPLHLQPKLLRVLQEGGFTKIGGQEFIPVDFRLITATNRNLEEMIRDGEFREDLYYRLNVIPINIPALKNRYEDIDLLVDYLLDKYCRILETGRKKVSEEARGALRSYDWPGNVRELENVIEYLVNIVASNEIGYGDLPTHIREKEEKLDRTGGDLKELVEDYERSILESYLNEYGRSTEDKEEISKRLNINLSTLYRKLSKYNLQ